MKKLIQKGWVRYSLMAIAAILVMAPTAVLAVHNFADVPDSHTFHNDVQWMLDNGITSGCGSGNYCPDSNVTRGQMAAFMKRLSTKQVVDAGTLQGSQPLATVRPLSFSTNSTATEELAQFQFAVPGPGTLLVTVQDNVWINADSGSSASLLTQVGFYLCQTSATNCSQATFVYYEDSDNTNENNATKGFSLSIAIPVSGAGTETLYLNGYSADGYTMEDDLSGQVLAIFLPGDGTSTLDPLAPSKTPSASAGDPQGK